MTVITEMVLASLSRFCKGSECVSQLEEISDGPMGEDSSVLQLLVVTHQGPVLPEQIGLLLLGCDTSTEDSLSCSRILSLHC